jgi:hypothetical protein
MNSAAKVPSVLLALFCAAVSLAQEGAAPPTPAPRPPPAEAERGREVEEPPAAAERPEVDDDEFIPTEELAPDAAVTFPVDI